ncbi:MAG: hydrogenase maturation protease, partial [Candidatus Bipolaricaulota bacterium]|nr:hydrogenase maturation protease [Candidatus Bipolaricaulota bacterium]
MSSQKSRVLVIGVGNDYRHDDAVGLIVARRLREKNLEHIAVREMSGEGAALISAWQSAERVIIVDAVQSGAAPGTIYRVEAHQEPIPTSFFHCSTHAFGVAEAIETARSLGQLPRNLIIYGIEGEDFSVGEGLSPE